MTEATTQTTRTVDAESLAASLAERYDNLRALEDAARINYQKAAYQSPAEAKAYATLKHAAYTQNEIVSIANEMRVFDLFSAASMHNDTHFSRGI